MALHITAAVRSDIGKVRANNEDSFYLDGVFLPKEEMDGGGSFRANASTDCAVFAVCDGMGGEDKGEEASHAVVRRLDGLRPQLAAGVHDVWEYIDAAVDDANREVVALSDGTGRNAGTTLALLCFYDDEAFCANLGDSRLYVLRDGGLVRLNRDHTEAGNLVAAGALTEEEAAVSVYKHVLTRYVGADNGGNPVVPARCEDFVLHYGDRFLLCSDGLTDMVPDAELQRLLSVDADPQVIATLLVNAALAVGGRDNVTAMVVEVEDEPESFAGLGVDADGVKDAVGDLPQTAGPENGECADEADTDLRRAADGGADRGGEIENAADGADFEGLGAH